jgi:hypothetical protein
MGLSVAPAAEKLALLDLRKDGLETGDMLRYVEVFLLRVYVMQIESFQTSVVATDAAAASQIGYGSLQDAFASESCLEVAFPPDIQVRHT